LAYPIPPKSPIKFGRLARQTKQNAKSDKKYKVCKEFNVYIKQLLGHLTFSLIKLSKKIVYNIAIVSFLLK
jgi:hypothetical protein